MSFVLGEASSQPLPVSSNDEAIQFIKRVLPPGGPGRKIGLHWFPNDPGSWAWATARKLPRPVMRGFAYDSAEDAVGYARWLLRKAEQQNIPAPDLYVCMALCGMEVSDVSSTGRPRFKATRLIGAHRASKTLFVDIDTRTAKKPNAYPDKPSTHAAIDALVAQGLIPSPTVRVDSGNGVHLHWVLDRELNSSEWVILARALESYLLANGILMDRGVAVDAVRVLRLPATVNMKDMANPTPTALVGNIDPNDIPVATFEALLGVSVAGAPPVPQAAPAQIILTAQTLPAPFLGHKPFVPVPADPEFSDGIDPNVHFPQRLDFDAVLAGCAALRAMHARKGAGDQGMLWMMALLAVTFLPEAERTKWAHELSSGHALYTPADTDAKLEEKLRARAASGSRIGWPTCVAFSRYCGECQGCPHFAKQATPLHLGVVAAPAVQAIQAVQAAQGADELPAGYTTDTRGVLVETVVEGAQVTVVVMPHHIEDVCIEERPEGAVLSARIMHHHNAPTRLRLPLAAATAWRDEATKALGTAQIALLPEQIPLARRLFVDYIQLLQSKQSNVVVRDPFGWVKTRDGAPGFAFDGRVFHAAGEEPAAAADDQFRTRYKAQGEIAPWKEAADLVMGMGRIDLQTAIATSFAAPLMRFTGLHGVIISVYSPFTGVQKSSALIVGQSVWGDPKTGMSRLDDTANAVSKKMGLLRHLPIYWDELQTRDQTAAFAKLAFGLAQGIEKSRMGADTKLRQSGEWSTVLVCGSNNSVREIMLAEQAEGSAAGIARVLEFEVRKVALTSSAAESAITLNNTNEHHGLVGVEYARLLASMHDKLPAALSAVSKSFEQKIKSDTEQRYWIAAASTIYLGASLANRLTHNGAPLIQFPLPALHKFLCDTIEVQQAARKADVVDTGSVENATRVVQGYIDHCRSMNTALETNTVPRGAGRPAPLEHRFITSDAQRLLRAPKVHIAHDDGLVRVIADDFRKWVTQERRLPFDAVKRDLEMFGAMSEQRSRWAAGTQWSGAITKYYQIDVHYARTPLGARIGLGK